MKTDWKKLITRQMEDNKDSFENVVSCSVSDEDLLRKFDSGYGGEEGCSFTLWTNDHVYFPIGYDGAEWAGSAPRNPSEESLSHQGGG